MRATIHLVSARDCLFLRPLVQPVADAHVQRPVRAPDRRDRPRRAAGRGPRAGRGAPAHPRRAARRARRPLARARRRGAGVRDHVHRPARAGHAARAVGPERTGDVDDDRVLARAPARSGCLARRARAALPRRVRARDRDGHPGVVRPDAAARGHRPPGAAAAARSARRTGASCSTCPTPRGPTPTRRRRRASCPSTTTSRSAHADRTHIFDGGHGYVPVAGSGGWRGSLLVDGMGARAVAPDAREGRRAAADRGVRAGAEAGARRDRRRGPSG